MIHVQRQLSSLDRSDFYHWTMLQAASRQAPFKDTLVKFRFICRDKTYFPPGFTEELRRQVQLTADSKLSPAAVAYMRQMPFLDEAYVDQLQDYKLDANDVVILDRGIGNPPEVFFKGPLLRVLPWESPFLSAVSELLGIMKGNLDGLGRPASDVYIGRARHKAEQLKKMGARFVDFGTRRAASWHVHKEVVKNLVECGGDSFIGTSNPALAAKHNVKLIGTYAHLWVMLCQAIFGYAQADEKAMLYWKQEFGDSLGIALADTLTTEVFLRAFTLLYALAYDGLRHDSGPIEKFVDDAVAHYESLNIDPMSKTIVFSDGLDLKAVETILEYCRDKIKCSFGIGTFLTNDISPGSTMYAQFARYKPPSIVVKLAAVALNQGEPWINVVKLSNEPGKYTGEASEIAKAKRELGIA